jgi:hypothetical protein
VLGVATYTLNLISIKETQAINEDPRKRAAEVEQLVDGEGHDAGGQDIILYPRIPCDPQSLCHAQVGIGFGDILILGPIGAGGQHGRIPRRKSVNMQQISQRSTIQPPRAVQKSGETDIVVRNRSWIREKKQRLREEEDYFVKSPGGELKNEDPSRELEHKSRATKGQARRADSHPSPTKPDNVHLPVCD